MDCEAYLTLAPVKAGTPVLICAGCETLHYTGGRVRDYPTLTCMCCYALPCPDSGGSVRNYCILTCMRCEALPYPDNDGSVWNYLILTCAGC